MSNPTIKNAIAAVLAIGLASASTAALSDNPNEAPKGMEKCYGVAKAGKNDCATATHGCSGEAKTDNEKEEWVSVPMGQCKKIVNNTK